MQILHRYSFDRSGHIITNLRKSVKSADDLKRPIALWHLGGIFC